MAYSKREFDVYNGLTDPEEFFRVFSLNALYAEWKDTELVPNLKLFLKGKAAEVYDTIAVTKTNFVDFKTGIIAACQMSKEMRLSHFTNRRMKPTESIYSYAQELKSLFRKAMGVEFKADDMGAFVQNQLVLNVPAEFRPMLKIAAAMGPVAFESFIQTLSQPLDSLGEDLSLGTEVKFNATQSNAARSTPNRNVFDGQCYNCEQFGHRIAFCPQPMRRKNNNNNGESRRDNGSQSYNSNNSFSSNRQNQYTSQYQSDRPNNMYKNNGNGNNRPNNNYNSNNVGRQRSQSNAIDANNISAVHQDGNNNARSNNITNLPDGLGFSFSDHMNIEFVEINSNSLSANTDVAQKLLIVEAKILLPNNETRQVKVLLDGGSTHSFISPFLNGLSDSWSKYKIRSKEFLIKCAMSTAQETCKIIDLDVSFGNWAGVQSFVLSSDIKRYDMVLGRDFFTKNGAIIDHGANSISINGGQPIDINNLLVDNAFVSKMSISEVEVKQNLARIKELQCELAELNRSVSGSLVV
jgi:hypothetical protein